jgi:hypothetical protein
MNLQKRLRTLHPSIDIAWNALTRNRLQTGLTMLGIAVGVATVLAMMAVGAGAQRSIEQQVRAAGLNQLTVTAGNWKPKVEDTGAAVAHQGDADDTLVLPIPELVPLPPTSADDVADASGGAPMPKPSGNSMACSTSRVAFMPTRACSAATSGGSRGCTAPTCSYWISSVRGRSRADVSSRPVNNATQNK